MFKIIFLLFISPAFLQGRMLVEEVYTPRSNQNFTAANMVRSIQRDPFYRVLEQPGWDATSVTDYDLNELNLVAVVWGVPKPIAMFSADSEKRFIVSLGDSIGKHGGKIVDISEGRVHIKELRLEFDGSRVERSIIKGTGN